jgi:fatty-acyl-CoA synthase
MHSTVQYEEIIMTDNNNKSPYDQGLETNGANYSALSPVNFIARTAEVYPEDAAIIYNELRRNWSETYLRKKNSLGLASTGYR